MALTRHSDLEIPAAAHPIWYYQADDPGAVGAGKMWMRIVSGTADVPTSLLLYQRNSTDTGWIGPILVGERTLGTMYGTSGSSGCLAATLDRGSAVISLAATAATSGTLRLWRIHLPGGLSVTNIAFWSGSTALSGGSNQWFGLFDSARLVLAKTADDTSTAWAAKTKKSLAVTGGPYVTTASGWYYLGVCIVAATVPTIQAVVDGQADSIRQDAPIIGGDSTVSLTNPASCTGTQTAITSLAQTAYGEVS